MARGHPTKSQLRYDLDPDLFVIIGGNGYQDSSLLEGIGLHKCKSEEGQTEMLRSLRLFDKSPSTDVYPNGSWFVPGPQMYVKPNYNSIEVGKIIPVRLENPDGSVVIFPGIGAHMLLDGAYLMVSLGGIYVVYNNETWQMRKVLGTTRATTRDTTWRMYELRLDAPMWARKTEITDMLEEAKVLQEKRKVSPE